MNAIARLVALFAGLCDRIPHSLVALLARLTLATIFWRSGETKVTGWHVKDSAIYLFREEYKLPLIDPVVGAHLAALGEHLFPALLVIGLASRAAAMGLLFMTLVIQTFVYPDAYVDHALWAIATLVVIAKGPGVFSLDHLVKRWWAARSPRPAQG